MHIDSARVRVCMRSRDVHRAEDATGALFHNAHGWSTGAAKISEITRPITPSPIPTGGALAQESIGHQ